MTKWHFSGSNFEDQIKNCLQQISDLRSEIAAINQLIASRDSRLPRRGENNELIIPENQLRDLIAEMIVQELPKLSSLISVEASPNQQFFFYKTLSQNLTESTAEPNKTANSIDFYYIPQLDREIKNLSEEIGILEAEMENRLAPLEAIDRHSIEEDLALQSQAIAELQEQVNQLREFYASRTQGLTEICSKIAQLEAGLNQLSQQIAKQISELKSQGLWKDD